MPLEEFEPAIPGIEWWQTTPWIARPSDWPGFLIGTKYLGTVIVLTRNLWKSIPS